MLRLLEHYVSPQGEGPKVGVMSQFVRFAGCNLKCPAWPCDTPHAIDPKLFQHEQRVVLATSLSRMISQVTEETGAYNIVFTGGEPLLQGQGDLAQVVKDLLNQSLQYRFEIFTNGTRQISAYLVNLCAFVLDWKLPGSGEDYLHPQRLRNIKSLDADYNTVKFTIASREDMEVALQLYKEFLEFKRMQVFAGVAWDKFETTELVDFIKANRLPWRLNVQVHNYIFGAHKRLT